MRNGVPSTRHAGAPSPRTQDAVLFSLPLSFFLFKIVSCKPTCRYLAKEIQSTTLKRHTFTGALFPTAETWKSPTRPSKGDWIKRGYLDATAYYSAVKNNEISPFGTKRGWTWRVLCRAESSQTENENHHEISPMCDYKEQNKDSDSEDAAVVTRWRGAG